MSTLCISSNRTIGGFKQVHTPEKRNILSFIFYGQTYKVVVRGRYTPKKSSFFLTHHWLGLFCAARASRIRRQARLTAYWRRRRPGSSRRWRRWWRSRCTWQSHRRSSRASVFNMIGSVTTLLLPLMSVCLSVGWLVGRAVAVIIS